MKIKTIKDNVITLFIKNNYNYQQSVDHLKNFPSELKEIILIDDKLKNHFRGQKLKKLING